MPSLDEIAARNAEIHRLHAVDGLRRGVLAQRFGLRPKSVERIVTAERRRRAAEGLPPLERGASIVAPPPPPPPPPRPIRGEKARLVPTRIVAMTPFGPDVEHADPAKAEAERAPLWGGRYPRSPSVSASGIGSPALACAEV